MVNIEKKLKIKFNHTIFRIDFNNMQKLILYISIIIANVSSAGSISINDINHVMPAKSINKILPILEKQYQFHKSALNLPEKLVVPINAFKKKSNYRKFQKKASKTSKSSNGFYSSSRKEVIVNLNDRYIKTILHESQHFILRSAIKSPHKWVNEGLSEFYEQAFIKNDDVYVKIQKKKLQRLKHLLKDSNKLNLDKFFSTTNKQWANQNKKSKYSSSLSWGLVYFFMDDSHRKYIFSKLYSQLTNKNTEALNLIENTYPGGIKALEVDFLKYLEKIPTMQKI